MLRPVPGHDQAWEEGLRLLQVQQLTLLNGAQRPQVGLLIPHSVEHLVLVPVQTLHSVEHRAPPPVLPNAEPQVPVLVPLSVDLRRLEGRLTPLSVVPRPMLVETSRSVQREAVRQTSPVAGSAMAVWLPKLEMPWGNAPLRTKEARRERVDLNRLRSSILNRELFEARANLQELDPWLQRREVRLNKTMMKPSTRMVQRTIRRGRWTKKPYLVSLPGTPAKRNSRPVTIPQL